MTAVFVATIEAIIITQRAVFASEKREPANLPVRERY